MITVDGIRKKAINKYNDYLRSSIEGISIFPWYVPSDKSINKLGGYDKEFEQIKTIVDHSKSAVGFGYTYEFDKNGKKITAIKFETEIDYLKFINKEDEVINFKNDYADVILEYPTLRELFVESPRIVIENHHKWADLIKVCRFFQTNSHVGLYMRELPAGVHTKFIENNTQIIFALIERISPELINYRAERFEDKFGLKTKHNLIRIRFLDDKLQVLPGYEEIGIAEVDINKLDIKCKRVFVIENDVPALVFPKIENSIVLFGKGYNVAALKNIEWIKNAEIYYWGDLDVHGFEILSQMYGYFNHTKSFLMSKDVLDEHKKHWSHSPDSKVLNISLPSIGDRETYEFIRAGKPYIRLEQEYISQQCVSEELKRIST